MNKRTITIGTFYIIFLIKQNLIFCQQIPLHWKAFHCFETCVLFITYFRKKNQTFSNCVCWCNPILHGFVVLVVEFRIRNRNIFHKLYNNFLRNFSYPLKTRNRFAPLLYKKYYNIRFKNNKHERKFADLKTKLCLKTAFNSTHSITLQPVFLISFHSNEIITIKRITHIQNVIIE